MRRAQLDLFASAVKAAPTAEPVADTVVTARVDTAPLIGLCVRLPDGCRCGAVAAIVGMGRGPHIAALQCTTCQRHRGWLPQAAAIFLLKLSELYGRPTTPITIRRGNGLEAKITRLERDARRHPPGGPRARFFSARR